ncbi:MAG TPA: branched-chain amino acid ABC transporter permease [Herpetosiphonaceae bacterium]|nr:branched-chain amino acid ABC transporter permease [Herpetosiphonaceae bacterium]
MQSGVFHTTYAQDMALHQTSWQKWRLRLLLLALAVFPFVANTSQLYLANTIAIAAVGAIGLNILVGFTGQISLGQGAFLAVGAYSSGLFTDRLFELFGGEGGLPFLLSMLLAASFTAVVGTLFGLPSLRLKGLYLAIATLAAQQIIIWVITHTPKLTGGESFTLRSATLFGLNLNQNGDFRFYWLLVPAAVLATLAATNLFRTRVGRSFVAVRDRDIAAEVMGINLFRTKLLAFAVSSFFVGLAGALLAHYRQVISPDRFEIGTSINFLAMIIIGGLGSVSGSIYGAAFMTLLPAVIESLGRQISGIYPNIDILLPYIQQGVFGLVIILFLVFEPEGIAKIWHNIKNYFNLWPFSY